MHDLPALTDGGRALGVKLDETQCALLCGYLDLMQKWTRTYNLTAVRDDGNMLTHHILDSLAVAPYLGGTRMADIGSGAGLPGIPLAIALSDRHFTLVEAVQKKAAFLRQATIELGLRNVTVVSKRVETWHPPAAFDVVLSRAFAHLRDFIRLAGHVCLPGGVMAAMKGVLPHEELAAVPPGYRVERVVRLEIPGLNAERHLILVKRDE